jgi:hypothetical protein
MDEITLKQGAPITMNTAHGPVTVDGIDGLYKLCTQLMALRAVKGVPGYRRGVTFASSEAAPSLLVDDMTRRNRAHAMLCDKCGAPGAHRADHIFAWYCDPCEVKRLREQLRARCEQLGTLMQEVRQKDDAVFFDTGVPEAIAEVKRLRELADEAQADRDPNLVVIDGKLYGPGVAETSVKAQLALNASLASLAGSIKAFYEKEGPRYVDALLGMKSESGPGLAAKYPDATKGGADPEPVTCDVGADWED